MTTSSCREPVRSGIRTRLFGIAAGDAGGGDVLESRGASGRDHPPLSAGQLGKPLADGFRQLVDLDEMPRGGIHRRAHLGSSTDPPMIVNVPRQLMTGLDADRLIDLWSGLQRTGGAPGQRRRGTPKSSGSASALPSGTALDGDASRRCRDCHLGCLPDMATPVPGCDHERAPTSALPVCRWRVLDRHQ